MRAGLVSIVLAVACSSSSHGSVDGAPESPDAAELAAPNLVARPGNNQALLSWTPVPGATAYTIDRSSSAGTAGITIGTTSELQLADTSAPLFEPSYYTVAAVGGERSNEAETFAYDFAHWTVRSTGEALNDVAYAPAAASPTGVDLYVAVGEHGEVLTSPNGQTWTFQHGPPMYLRAVVFGGGRFVAVGSELVIPSVGVIATSPDGVTWTIQTAPPASYRDVLVAYDGPIANQTAHYVAVGAAGTIATSTDGSVWTSHTCGTTEIVTVGVTQQVVTSTMRFGLVAAGNGTSCFSFDAATWTASATPYNWIATATGDDDVVMLNLNGVYVERFHFNLAASTASVNFGTAPTTATYRVGLTSMMIGGTRWLFSLDGGGHLWASTNDGSTFTDQGATFATPLAGTAKPRNLVALGGHLFVPGQASQLYYSADASSFTIVVDSYADTLQSIAAGHGRTVAVSSSGDTVTSVDGLTWVRTVGPGGLKVATNVIATNTGFAYISDVSGALALQSSTDGIAWTSTPIPYTLCSYCTYDGGVLVAREDRLFAQMATSKFSILQGMVAITGPQSNPTATDVALTVKPMSLHDDGTSLSLLAGDAIYSSTDGTTWSETDTLPISSATAYLVNGTTRYAANYAGALSWSSAPQVWSTPVVIDPRGVSTLIQTADRTIAAGSSGYLAASSDGQAFTTIDLPIYSDFYAMTVTDRGFALVGANHLLVTAP